MFECQVRKWGVGNPLPGGVAPEHRVRETPSGRVAGSGWILGIALPRGRRFAVDGGQLGLEPGGAVEGCATWKWRSGRAARLPVVLQSAIEVAATQGNDGVSPSNRPEHAGLFEAGTDDRLASSFDDA